ncbi:MAG: DoxX family protein [Bacteroidales bacterium]|nr:DoxX family protein [Bacteroidales bacterium]
MKKNILLVVCILFALIFINAGLNKLLHYIPVPEDMPENMMKMSAAFEQIGWLMPLIAIVEIIGGILFMIPKFRPLGAIVIFPIVIGILLIHILIEPSGFIMAFILFSINIIVIIENWKKYLPMVK